MKADEYLRKIDYPGRIIIMGYGKDGRRLVLYAITGRSENSRNRVIRMTDGIVRTFPYDESKVEDPSLIIYNALCMIGDKIICTNGEHTDVIYDTLSSGGDMSDALIRFAYEPDAPAYTPRISGVLGDDGYSMSIARKDGDSVLRLLYSYGREDGIGHIIHTYNGNGDPLPSFDSIPARIDITEDIVSAVWDSLGRSFRVALFAMYGDEVSILNEKEGDGGKA